jgi:tetratricopeptide (TPR) repeat protein
MPEPRTKGDRVDGWKTIADYLARDVTTVIRWAKLHGLPVNRAPAGGPRRAVFALKSEIDGWVAGRASLGLPDTGNGHAPAVDPSSSDLVPSIPQAPSVVPAASREIKAPRWLKPTRYGAIGSVAILLAWAGWRYAEEKFAFRSPWFTPSQQLAANGLEKRGTDRGNLPSEQGPAIFRGSFECVGCGADKSYLASGLADQLASDLIRIPGVHVRAADAAPNPPGRESIRLVLTGTVVPKEDARIAVTIFLAGGDTHEQLWSRHYETLVTGLPVLEFEIANDIFRYLKPSLPARDTTPFKAVWTRDPVAYDLYLRGRDHIANTGPVSTPAAIQEFSEAVRRDPGFAAAYGGLAWAYLYATFDTRIPTQTAMPLAKSNALRELELDPLAADGHAALATEELNFEYKWQSAEREYQRAIALNPDDPLVHYWYVWLLKGESRWEEAIKQAEISKSLDPNAQRGDFALAIAQVAKGGATGNPDDFAAAVSTCRKAIQHHPDYPKIRDVLVYALWYSHRYKEAAEENLSMAEVMQDATAIAFKRSAKSILATWGPSQYALAMAHFCEPRAGADYTCELNDTASWYAFGGDTEDAMRLLTESVKSRDGGAVLIPQDPALASLRNDPRFQRLVAQFHPGSD